MNAVTDLAATGAGSMPVAAGIGLRAPHVARVLAERPRIAWLETHSENLFAAGGPFHNALEGLRADYPLSLHGVGLSLGSADALDHAHLARLKELVNRYQPELVSEHLCWGAIGGMHSNDLLPLPFTEEALRLVVERIGQVQDALGRQILVENVSTYLRFEGGDYTEWEFVAEAVQRSGCGLLCDVNNIYVNSVNHGFNPSVYLQAMPRAAVQEIHLAGFTRKDNLPVPLLIDSHSRRVSPEVWDLYAEAIARFGPVPTLIEWDQDIPELEVLLDEAAHAQGVLDARRALAA
ncbi:MAG: MNIO family bufferin maturase [Rhodanobacteraceae bacterium]